MDISEVCKLLHTYKPFEYVTTHYKWCVDLNDRPDLDLQHFKDADQWCVTTLPDKDFVIAPRKFYFRYLTDATLFRLIFS